MNKNYIIKENNSASTEKLICLEIESKSLIKEQEDNLNVKITLLWIDISRLSKTSQIISCCVGLFVFYLIYGYLLELIFTLDGLKPFGWYITLMQFGYYSVFGWTENCLSSNKKRKIPIKTYFLLAGLTVGTMGFSNTSLQFLNYPTQVIFKSCKLIPVMLGGIVIQKKKFRVLDFLAAFLMCFGLAWFTLADSYISPKFSMLGVMMISLALLCDAIIGNIQEKAMKSYQATNTEVVFYSYSLGFVFLLIILFLTGKLLSGFYFCLNNPLETYGYGFLFSISGYLGVQIVLTLVKTFGAVAAATVTTCRKAISIVLSFVFFTKPVSLSYFWSGLIVLLGIYLNVCSKSQKNISFDNIISKHLHLCQRIFKNKFRRKKLIREFSI